MTDDHLDRLLKHADPYDADRIGDLRGGDLTLLEEIMSTPPIEQVSRPVRFRRQRSLRTRLVVGVAAAAAMTAAIGVPAWLAERDAADPGDSRAAERGDGSADRITYSAAAIEAAEKNPRLLIDEPGWQATHVYGFTEGEGTIVFSQGDRDLEMNWYPARSYDSYFEDRLDVGEPRPITVAGQPGSLFRYSAHDFAVMLEPKGGSFVELRTGIGGWTGESAAMQVFAKVKAVDVHTWLAALPPEIVTPDGARDIVQAMLADIPKPPGFDVAPLLELGPSDRYQLGAEVTGAVTCGWLEVWVDARRAGDDAAAARAAAALEGSHRWRILHEMNARGDWPESMWDVANRVSAGESVSQIRESVGDICGDRP